jgi:uncharacterized protein YcbK (DUF882 family)
MRKRVPCCEHETKDHIATDLLQALKFIESEFGQDLQFSSGLRCKECNAKVGGVRHSEHISGEGADILVSNSEERFALILLALRAGYVRIGVGRTFVHVGVSTTLPQEVLWLY